MSLCSIHDTDFPAMHGRSVGSCHTPCVGHGTASGMRGTHPSSMAVSSSAAPHFHYLSYELPLDMGEEAHRETPKTASRTIVARLKGKTKSLSIKRSVPLLGRLIDAHSSTTTLPAKVAADTATPANNSPVPDSMSQHTVRSEGNNAPTDPECDTSMPLSDCITMGSPQSKQSILPQDAAVASSGSNARMLGDSTFPVSNEVIKVNHVKDKLVGEHQHGPLEGGTSEKQACPAPLSRPTSPASAHSVTSANPTSTPRTESPLIDRQVSAASFVPGSPIKAKPIVAPASSQRQRKTVSPLHFKPSLRGHSPVRGDDESILPSLPSSPSLFSLALRIPAKSTTTLSSPMPPTPATTSSAKPSFLSRSLRRRKTAIVTPELPPLAPVLVREEELDVWEVVETSAAVLDPALDENLPLPVYSASASSYKLAMKSKKHSPVNISSPIEALQTNMMTSTASLLSNFPNPPATADAGPIHTRSAAEPLAASADQPTTSSEATISRRRPPPPPPPRKRRAAKSAITPSSNHGPRPRPEPLDLTPEDRVSLAPPPPRYCSTYDDSQQFPVFSSAAGSVTARSIAESTASTSRVADVQVVAPSQPSLSPLVEAEDEAVDERTIASSRDDDETEGVTSDDDDDDDDDDERLSRYLTPATSPVVSQVYETTMVDDAQQSTDSLSGTITGNAEEDGNSAIDISLHFVPHVNAKPSPAAVRYAANPYAAYQSPPMSWVDPEDWLVTRSSPESDQQSLRSLHTSPRTMETSTAPQVQQSHAQVTLPLPLAQESETPPIQHCACPIHPYAAGFPPQFAQLVAAIQQSGLVPVQSLPQSSSNTVVVGTQQARAPPPTAIAFPPAKSQVTPRQVALLDNLVLSLSSRPEPAKVAFDATTGSASHPPPLSDTASLKGFPTFAPAGVIGQSPYTRTQKSSFTYLKRAPSICTVSSYSSALDHQTPSSNLVLRSPPLTPDKNANGPILANGTVLGPLASQPWPYGPAPDVTGQHMPPLTPPKSASASPPGSPRMRHYSGRPLPSPPATPRRPGPAVHVPVDPFRDTVVDVSPLTPRSRNSPIRPDGPRPVPSRAVV